MDLYFHEADIDPYRIQPNNRVWLVVSYDGADVPLSTTDTKMQKKSLFNFRMSINLSVPDIKSSYLYIQLCCFGDSDEEMLLFGKSKVRICNLPLNGPNAFRIPLYSPDQKTIAASLCISGIIDPPLSEQESSS